MIGNFGYLIPSTFYIYLGASAKELVTLFSPQNESTTSDNNIHNLKLTILLIGGLALFIVLSIVAYLTKRELDRMIDEEEE